MSSGRRLAKLVLQGWVASALVLASYPADMPLRELDLLIEQREQAKQAAQVQRDRDAVLELVREHRGQATDEWQQQLTDAIFNESLAHDIDPLMVASIVARESSFRTRVVSSAGAIGLMQLRSWVAEDVAVRRGVEWNGIETLHAPDLNVRLGILYYQELVDRFEGDQVMALTAYNYGPTRVSRQVHRGTYKGSNYADRILDLYTELNQRRTGPDAADSGTLLASL